MRSFVGLVRRIFPFIVALGCGGTLGYVAFHSSGFDWYVSETQAEIIYSALHRYHELPVFSYFLNGGTYLLQDPQSFLLTPVTPLILLFGPHAGIRVAIALWGVVGCLGMFYLLRDSVGKLPALFSGMVWVLSLGVFWRIIVGNDMFAWNLALPWLLIFIKRLYAKPTFARSLSLGMFLGFCLLGPTFHSFIYFLIPISSVWTVIQLCSQRKIWSKSYVLRSIVFSVLALVLAVVSALPKLYAFEWFDLSRPTCAEGVITKVEAWNALFAQDATLGGYHLTPVRQPTLCQQIDAYGVDTYGNWESSVGLLPIAYLLITVVVLSLFRRTNRLFAVFAILLIGTGWILATSEPIWLLIRNVSHDGIRVSSRFLQIITFAMTLLVAFGYALIQRGTKFWQRSLLFMVAVSLFSVQLISWTYQASILQSDYHGRVTTLLTQKQPIFDVSSIVVDQNTGMLGSLTNVIYNGQYVWAPYLIITGNVIDVAAINNFFASFNINSDYTFALSPQLSRDRLQITHHHVEISSLQPAESVTLYLRSAELGQTVNVTPDVPITISNTAYSQTITNTSDQVITSLTIDPVLPTHWSIWAIWLVSWIGAFAYSFTRLWYNHCHANNL